MALTYSEYLNIEKLLSIQQPKSSPPEHDEMLFIIIHQTYELWFKQLLHELEKVAADFRKNDLYGAIATTKRCRTIMKVLVEQMDILETMTPLSFASFRNRLETASGFQSYQYREVEYFLGFKRPEMLKYYAHIPGVNDVLKKRLSAPSLIDSFYQFLSQQGVTVPAELLNKKMEEPNVANEKIQDGVFHLFKTKPDVTILLELMTDFDEGVQEWRYRHVKLVERTIGVKYGTGGSPGVPFLKESLFKPLFPDLWAVRSRF